jgi:serine/threonine-protein kinase
MSIVYAAIYEAQQREVAVKVLDLDSANDPDAIARFDHEARTASSLSHGHVVGVSDFGRLPDGRPYLVMPLIMGQDLATVISEHGPMPAARVAALLAGVASALDAMHAQGLVHRDIKSENIMYVRADNGTESALVLDFGIAANPSAINDGQMTDTSGTPDFMAPEALSGEPSDHRADIYSLATVAFELLTSRLPYSGNNLTDLLKRRAKDKPRTLSKTTGISFHPALEAVFARGLARKPSDRPSSAGELIRELAAAATQARAPLTGPAKKSPMRRAATLKARALQALGVATPEGGERRLARLRTLVGLPFTRPVIASTNESSDGKLEAVKKALPAPTSTPQSGVHRKPARPAPRPEPLAAQTPEPASVTAPQATAPQVTAPQPAAAEPPQREASIVIDPSLWQAQVHAPPQQPIDSLSPVAELEIDEPPLKVPFKAWGRIGLMAAAALVVLAFRLWSHSEEPRTEATSQPPAPVVEATPPRAPAPLDVPAPIPAAVPVQAAAPAPAPPAPEPARIESERAAAQPRPSRATKPKPERAPARAITAPSPSASSGASASALTQEGIDAMLRGDFSIALSKLDGATSASPRYAPAYRSKGLVLERMARSKDAAKAFQTYLRLDPDARDAEKIKARLSALE